MSEPDEGLAGAYDRFVDAQAHSAQRQARLRDLEWLFRGPTRPDYEVIGLLSQDIAVGRQISGQQYCTTRLRTAAMALVDAETELQWPGFHRVIAATLNGEDIATVLTLMHATDSVTSASYCDVEIHRGPPVC